MRQNTDRPEWRRQSKQRDLIHFGTRTQVPGSNRQEAWADRWRESVAFSGTFNAQRMGVAIRKKLCHPGSIVGSSYGSTNANLIGLDPNDPGRIIIEFTCGIGE